MTDPYGVLGVSRSASDDDIKKAYRKLSRQYHPDANVNNPDKAQAEEKFKQIQQAYRQIMQERERGAGGSDSAYGQGAEGYDPFGFGGFGGFGSFGGFGGYAGAGSRRTAEEDEDTLHMKAAANYINGGHYKEALNVLNIISERRAKWYYYSAIANAGCGNNVQALQYAKQAAAMEPGNISYQRLVQQLESGGSWYMGRQSPYMGMGGMQGNLCNRLCLSYLMCTCCSGGCCYAPYGVYCC